MSPRIIQAALGLLLILGVLGSAVIGIESCKGNRVNPANETANIQKGSGDAHRAEATSRDSAAEDLRAQLQKSQKNVDSLTSQRAALLARLAELPNPFPNESSPTPPPDIQTAIISKDAELIAAQVEEIRGLRNQNEILTQARDAWKATALDRQREAASLRIALDAQRSLSTASKWRGRIEGFTVGVVLGYAGGRR